MTAQPPPFPVHVLTGALGVGKTTAIAHLLATKAEDERWAVILNEFTETGIDALTLAAAARGAYDVRLVPGGCLCCASELDFTRTLVQLVREQRPVRLLVEPSGIGHPAAIAEELLQHEARGHLKLAGIICLVDGLRATQLLAELDAEAAGTVAARSVERDQFEVSDVLVLSKADLATEAQRYAFQALAVRSFPPKRWVGEMTDGQLPPEALALREAAPTFWPARPHEHTHERAGGATAEAVASLDWPALDEGPVIRRITRRLGRAGVSWVFPAGAVFARLVLLRFLSGDAGSSEAIAVERAKGVFRTGPHAWWRLQRHAGGADAAESSWRLDSRIEVMFAPTVAGAALDEPALLAAIDAWETAFRRSLDTARAAPVNLAAPASSTPAA